MLITNPSSTYESVPRYFRMPRDVHREHLRVIALALLEAGERVSVVRLRECGVRGGTAALIALRQELVAAGELPPEAAARVSVVRLRECGVRGGTAALIALRQELVAAGELPPEAAARVYAPPVHPPGKRRAEERGRRTSKDGRMRTKGGGNSSSDLGATPQAGLPPADRSSAFRPHPSVLLKRRRSRRLIGRYDSAVRHIFGEDCARQIGAAPRAPRSRPGGAAP